MMSNCPRCGAGAYETLRSHSYCIDCNYSPTLYSEHEPSIPRWAFEALGGEAFQTLINKIRGPITPAVA